MIEFAALFEGLIVNFGYIGVFIVSLIGSATIVLPLPAFTIIFVAGAFLNPWLVAFFAALGSAFGEMVSYGIGFYGRRFLRRLVSWGIVSHKSRKVYREELKKGKNWMSRHHGFVIVFFFAMTPLPDDIIGLACGVLKYDWKKFLLACFLGKLVLSLFLAFSGDVTLGWLLNV